MLGSKIIAVDFDGTLFENAWPEIGAPREEIIHYIKQEQANGAKIILWTCRAGEKLENAIKACAKYGIHFDAVNENIPEIINIFGSDTRKIVANEYLDDLAINANTIAHIDQE